MAIPFKERAWNAAQPPYSPPDSITWKLCTTMRAEDDTNALDLALKASVLERATVVRRHRLLADSLPPATWPNDSTTGPWRAPEAPITIRYPRSE